MEQVSVIGLDLAKNVFQVHGADERGRCVIRKSLRRAQVYAFFAKLSKCTVGMEACSSSHYWGRVITDCGHEVKLIPPQYVKPYVKTNKNDAVDAEAICEAVSRPHMRFVELKTPDQQSILLIHRERDGLMRDRTALINRLRATLGELGIAVPSGPARLKQWFRESYGLNQDQLPVLMQRHIEHMRARWVELERCIGELDCEIDHHVQQDSACKRLLEVPGIGRLTASALVATVGNALAFKNGRQLSAWLGLVPRQHSSGGKTVLRGISKRGDAYLRRMLVHGARAVLRHSATKKNAVSNWLHALSVRANKNVVIVAMANKLARIAWALLNKGQRYIEPAAE